MLSRPKLTNIFSEANTQNADSCAEKRLAFWDGLGCIPLSQVGPLAQAKAICDQQGAKLDPKTKQCILEGGGSTAMAKCQPPQIYDPFKGDCMSQDVAQQRAKDAMSCHESGKYWDAHTASCVKDPPQETLCADGKPADPKTACNRMLSSSAGQSGTTSTTTKSDDNPSKEVDEESQKSKVSTGAVLGALALGAGLIGGVVYLSRMNKR